jgi:hypothetical protein
MAEFDPSKVVYKNHGASITPPKRLSGGDRVDYAERSAQEAKDAGEAPKKGGSDTPKKTSSKADEKIDRYAKFKKKQPRAQAVAKAVGGMGKKDSTNGQRYKPASDGVDAAFDRIIDTLTMRRSAK